MGRVSSCKQQHQHHVQRAHNSSLEKHCLSQMVHGVHICLCPKKPDRLVHGTGLGRLQKEMPDRLVGRLEPDRSKIVPQLSVTLLQQLPLRVRMNEHPTKA